WVKCRACSPEKDAPYKHVSRAAAEIQERARLADSKAPYVNQAPPNRSRLEGIAASTPATAAPVAHTGVSQDKYDKLLDKLEKLTDQVTALLEENRMLRARLDSQAAPVKKRKTKGGDDDSSDGPTNKRSLS